MCFSASLRFQSLVLLVVVFTNFSRGGEPGEARSARPLLLAHYMPWYTADAAAGRWGWHWTMNHFDPQKKSDGRREIASAFYPLVGPYDSGNSAVLECQLLLMKRAGIDGVIVDWYGLTDANDYAELHRHTERLVAQVQRLGMRLVICYEDQTVSALEKLKRLDAKDRVPHVVKEINWLAKQWFSTDSYVHLDGRPVLLSFGYDGLTNQEWERCLQDLEQPVAYFSEHQPRRTATGKVFATGGYDWPNPGEGLSAVKRFHEQSAQWEQAIPVVFPRFIDIYAEAGVHPSYGRVEDRGGSVFRDTLRLAIESGRPLIQIATWNDWGEGTQIEPSVEFRFRDLESLQAARRRYWDTGFRGKAGDLSIILDLYRLRNRRVSADARPTMHQKLDQAALAISGGDIERAGELLRSASEIPIR